MKHRGEAEKEIERLLDKITRPPIKIQIPFPGDQEEPTPEDEPTPNSSPIEPLIREFSQQNNIYITNINQTSGGVRPENKDQSL